MNPQLPVFLPFLGAYVALTRPPFDPWRNALVSLAGPFAGGIGGVACLCYGNAIDSNLLRALGYSGFLLNLFNLIPIGFLDGGHILRSWRVLRAGGGRANPAEARRLRGSSPSTRSLSPLPSHSACSRRTSRRTGFDSHAD